MNPKAYPTGNKNPMEASIISLNTNGRIRVIINQTTGKKTKKVGLNVAAIPSKKEPLKAILRPSELFSSRKKRNKQKISSVCEINTPSI